MSEIPTVALIIVSLYSLHQYCELGKKGHAYAFSIFMALSVYSKHLAIFMLPVFLIYFVMTRGFRGLIAKEVIISIIIMIILISPLIPITLKYSQINISFSDPSNVPEYKIRYDFLYYPRAIWEHLLTLPVLILSLISLVVSLFKRERKSLLFLIWIIVFYVQITYIGNKLPRFAIYLIPAFCLFAAHSIHILRYRAWQIFATVVIIVISGFQGAIALQTAPERAEGYEEAAEYVIKNKKGVSVLFSSVHNDSYFIFFLRKHNIDEDLIALRADKLLATSRMSRIIEDRISTRGEIYDILQKLGTAYVIVDNNRRESHALELLRKEVQSESFILRKSIPIKTNSKTLAGTVLNIYEYRYNRPPKPGTILDLKIPLMGGSVTVPFDDIITEDNG
jgi:hypothetical protein